MARSGQPQRLGALSGADVQHPQPAPGVRAGRAGAGVTPWGLGEGGQLLVQLAGDQLLPDGVPQSAEAGRPDVRAAAEAARTGYAVPGYAARGYPVRRPARV